MKEIFKDDKCTILSQNVSRKFHVKTTPRDVRTSKKWVILKCLCHLCSSLIQFVLGFVFIFSNLFVEGDVTKQNSFPLKLSDVR